MIKPKKPCPECAKLRKRAGKAERSSSFWREKHAELLAAVEKFLHGTTPEEFKGRAVP